MLASQVEHLFTGRRTALLEINQWLRSRTDPPLFVVTGDPGSGKSAVLGRVVTTADPQRRRRLPRRDRGVRAPLWSVACEVHAKGKSVADISGEIGSALGASGMAGPLELHVVLAKALKGRRRRFVLVLDALDEADAPRAVVKEILNPLLRASPSLGVRVLVGTRRTDEIGSLPATLEGRQVTVDLDNDQYFSRDDLRAYAKAWLQIRPDGPYTHEPQADLLATEIAHRAGHNFLVAGLVAAHHGRDDQQPVRPQELTGGTSLAEALNDFLTRVPDVNGVSARLLLVPLAYAQAPGLPVDLWAELVQALTDVNVTIGSLEAFARSGATNLLVTTGGTGTSPVYRLFHQALNDTLVTERDQRALGDQDRATIADALRQMIPAEGWYAAPAYLARSLGGHLVAAGQLAEIESLLTSSDYLLYADLLRLSTAITGLGSPTLRGYRRLIGITPHAALAGPEDRAGAFSVSTLQIASPQLTDAVTGMLTHARSAVRPRWGALPPTDRLLQIVTDSTDSVGAVAVTPDGTRAITGSGGHFTGSVRVWDLATGTEQAVLTGHTERVTAVAVTPDGTRAITGSNDRTVRVWNLTTGTEEAVMTGHSDRVTAVAVTPSGSHVVTGSNDGTVQEWCLTTKTEQAVRTSHLGLGKVVAVTPDGTHAVTSDHGTVRVWDLTTGTEQAFMDADLTAVAMTPDGTRVVTGSGSGRGFSEADVTARVWYLRSGKQRTIRTGHTGKVNAIAVTPDGTRAVTGGDDRTVRIWNLKTGTEEAVMTDHTGAVSAVAVTRDGTRAITGSTSGSVRVWDLDSGTRRASQPGHAGHVMAVAVTPDGTRAVTGGDDRTVRIWNLKTGTEEAVMTDHTGAVSAVAVTRDGTRAITGSSGDHFTGSVCVWDLATGTEQAVLAGHTSWVTAVAVTSDGTRAISRDSNRTVRVWDLTTGSEEAVLTDFTEEAVLTRVPSYSDIDSFVADMINLVGVAAMPDGNRAVTCDSSGTLLVWDDDLKVQQALRTGQLVRTPPFDWTSTLTVAPDGIHLVTGGSSGSVRVWDLVAGVERATLNGHTRGVNTVVVTPDGAHVVTGSDDETVRVWDLASGTHQAVLPVPGSVSSLAVSGSTLVIALTTGFLALDVAWDRLISRK
ncbi:AAA family ATPase [Promicromonospora sp. NPDC023805]|uniref:AAA family ATPase n=1 Tax=Promicromonospora sp. NPDC023805 TaxID=3154696 RepID=UPI0033C8C873